MGFFRSDSDPLRFAIDVEDRHRPERNQINSGDEFGEKRRQKLPVPAQKVDQQGSDAEVEYVLRGRESAFKECGENDDLERIRNDGQNHRRSKLRTRRDCDVVVSHTKPIKRLTRLF